MSDVMTISKRNAAGLEEVLRTLLLDSDNKVPAERLRIVGALTSGHIIESGSNANGSYVRFADGAQWCWAMLTAAPVGATRARIIWSYPASFGEASSPVICGIVDMASAYAAAGSLVAHVVMAEAVARTTANVQVLRGDSANINQTANYKLWVLAIGKWK